MYSLSCKIWIATLYSVCVYFFLWLLLASHIKPLLFQILILMRKKNNCPNITIILHGNFKKITKNEQSFSPKRCTNLGTTPNIHSHYCYILKVYSINAFHLMLPLCSLDILFSSNHNIHKSSYGLCFWTSDPLIDSIY